MLKIIEESSKIVFELSSDSVLVDRVVQGAIDFAKNLSIEKYDKLSLVIRELTLNAIEHGNKFNIEKNVLVEIEQLSNARFSISVADKGDGFNLKNIDLAINEDPTQHRSRGIPLVNSLADEITLDDNGNKITAYLTLSSETSFTIQENENYQVIQPNGNLTASSAEKLRTLLVEQIDEEKYNYLFDFASVRDIDSIMLSLLITFSKMVKKKFQKVELKIINVNDEILNLFKLTRINRIYDISQNGDKHAA